MARRWAVLALAFSLAAGPALAGDFLVRTVGSATAIALDRDSIRRTGGYRSGWTYELYRESYPLGGPRVQITAVLAVVDCESLASRQLKVVHFLADGRMVSQIGPQRAWTDDPYGSNADLRLRALCGQPDRDWASRQAATVFELYRRVWR
jgi:hypothetical protein